MKVNKHLHMRMRPSVHWFSSFREQIMRVWSRTNLEGRSFAWTGTNIRCSKKKTWGLNLLVSGEFLFSELLSDSIRRAIRWKNYY
jgi:hypothetical protein